MLQGRIGGKPRRQLPAGVVMTGITLALMLATTDSALALPCPHYDDDPLGAKCTAQAISESVDPVQGATDGAATPSNYVDSEDPQSNVTDPDTELGTGVIPSTGTMDTSIVALLRDGTFNPPDTAESGLGLFTGPDADSAAAGVGVLPSDCLGWASPAIFVNISEDVIYGRGGATCKYNAFITIKVCVAVKDFGISVFSSYHDVSCGRPQTAFGTKVGPFGHGINCLDGDHKYRTHVYVTVTRGSYKGAGSGYQSGRLQKDC